MRKLLVRLAVVSALFLSVGLRLDAHESDQYSLPVGREFIDLGDHFTAWVFGAVERGVNKTNAKIRSELSAGRDATQFQTDVYVAQSINREFPYAIMMIEDLDKQMTSGPMKDRWPGYLPGYKPPPTLEKVVMFPLNPFRAWNCASMKLYGVHLGSDKIGHFTDMGMHYYQTYHGFRRRGETEEQAMRRAIAVGTGDPLKSESALLGYWTAGAYSNADMAVNYVGLLFYRNLTEPQMLKGRVRPPMLVRDGAYWKIAPHVTRNSDFFTWFISEHLDEALNPSHYLAGLREGMRKLAVENAASVLEHRRDMYGNRRTQQHLHDLTQSLKTYYGVDYGHTGVDDELILVDRDCFPAAAGSDPRARDPRGRTALHIAAEVGDVDAAGRLLSAGADVNAQIRSNEPLNSDWGNTPLHQAALSGRAQMVQWLLDRGASASAASDRGVTPLHLAVDSPQVVQILLARGAAIDARDVRGRTPLHFAAFGGAVESLALLLDNGASANVRDIAGRTPLWLAARHGKPATAAALVRRGADIGLADQLGATALHAACSARSREVVQMLLGAQAPLDITDQFGCTPLHEATRRQADSVVALLLEAGASPLAADRFGGTPLHLASRHGDRAIVQMLLEHGADTHARAGARGTPIDQAIKSGDKSIVSILRDEDARAGVAAGKRQ